MIDEGSDCTSEEEKSFEGGRRSVYAQRLFGIGGFPNHLSLHVLVYGKQQYDFENLFTLVFPFLHTLFLDMNF